MQADWYRNFFEGTPLDVWSGLIREHTSAEADFLQDVLDLRRGNKVLDVPCGDGRLCIELSLRGYDMTGLDISQEYLLRAREQSEAQKVAVEWLHGDMAEIESHSKFDAAFCFGNSFGYLDHEGTKRFLSSLSQALKPRGRFALDTAMAAESILLNMEERCWVETDGILMLTEHRYVAEESRLDTSYIFVKDGRTERRESAHHVFTMAETRHMLEAVGLRTVALYSTLDKEPFELGEPRLLLVAEKG